MRVPVIYSPHAFSTLSPRATAPERWLYRTIEALMTRLTDRVICTSFAEQEHARQLGISQDRLALIFNGSQPVVGMPREQVRKSLGLAEDQVVVGFVGRMEEQKAPQRLVAVARRLLPELPKLRFLMIGDGPKRSALEASLGNAGLSDRVTWLGAVDSWQYFAGMDIFALPSLYEGFAYVLLEALSVGLPIVSTPVGGARESIAPGVNGMIVPHDSPEEMAVAIRELATSDDLRRAMGEASRLRAAQFSVQGMIDAIESLYFQVHSAKAAPGQAQRIGDPRIRSA